MVLPGQEQPASGVRESAKASDILDAAAALVEPKGAWTQGARARSVKGRALEPDSPDAFCWCIVGAVQRVDAAAVETAYRHPALKFVRRTVAAAEASGWNDRESRTQAEVVAKLREAAELARREGQ